MAWITYLSERSLSGRRLWRNTGRAVFLGQTVTVKRNSEKKANETDLILKARASLTSITWEGQMSYCRKNTSTLHLVLSICSTDAWYSWPSDDHINMMVEELKTNWKIIWNSRVQRFKLPTWLLRSRLGQSTRSLLIWVGIKNFSADIKIRPRMVLFEWLYFPLHVNNNSLGRRRNWFQATDLLVFISKSFFLVNQVRLGCSYMLSGDSLHGIGQGGGAPVKFVVLLQTWLKHDFGNWHTAP